MSVSLREKLAAKLQNTAIGNIVADKPIAKGSAFLLIRLLNAKDYDSNAVAISDRGITFGDLAETTDVRPDGSNGTHYPAVWDLSQTEASQVITWLEQRPNKKNSSSGYRQKKNSSPNSATGSGGAATRDEVRDIIQNVVLDTIVELFGNEQPSVANGFSKAESVSSVEPQPIELNVGDVVSIGGEIRQVVERANGSFGFNKTIIAD